MSPHLFNYLILYIIAEALRKCCHVRQNDPLKYCHVYNFFFKKPYVALEWLTFRHQPTYPKKEKRKKNIDPYKNTKLLIHKTKEKKKEKRKKKPQTLKPKPYFPIKIQTQTCNSSLHLHIHTDRNSVFQPIKKKKKKNLCNNENLCLFSAIVKTKNPCSSSATTIDLEELTA